MAGWKTLLALFVLFSNHLYVGPEAFSRCPSSCQYVKGRTGRQIARLRSVKCHCPGEDAKGSHCSWLGHGGTYIFPVCLDAIPTDFERSTREILIKHLRSSTIFERSFASAAEVGMLQITQSNVSVIQPGAFRGLSEISLLRLDDNRISSLESDTFLGLEALKSLRLEKNAIFYISQNAFRGLHSLTTLSLSHNHLRYVPVAALLQLKALRLAFLQENRITTIDDQVSLLNESQRLRLRIGGNELHCNESLAWFICNLPDLDVISKPESLKCAAPAELCGTLLTTLREDVDLNKSRQRRGPGGICDSYLSESPASMVPGATILSVNTLAYNETIPTEDNKDTMYPHTNTVTVSEYTTEVNHVILLTGDSESENDDNRSYLVSMITAVAVPLLFALAVALYFYNTARDVTEQREPNGASSQNVEPYAVVYSVADLPASEENTATDGRPTSTHDQTSENSTIQPYAVTYADGVTGKGEDGKLQPYAKTSFDDSVSVTNDEDPGPQLQPYAVTYDEDPGPQLQSNAVTHDEDPGPQLQPYAVTHDEDPGPQLQPYAVTHDEDPGPQLQPYSVTYDDPGPQLQPYAVTNDDDPGPQLQPYAVTHDEDPGPQLQPYSVTYE
ncbi:hypothetical protein Bbelb_189190 [Branchiostoma belcheri]|nr:hypothetical protein Bbelb_189190 [Branchiostoma belcheri]